MATDDDQDLAFNPQRQLCPDGTCLGVIGSDGRCTECGRRAEGAAPDSAESEPRPSDALPPDDGFPPVDEGEGEPTERDGGGPAFDPDRRLCSDGSCIGIVGKHNRCQLCGKPA
jgi:hypothetical protein